MSETTAEKVSRRRVLRDTARHTREALAEDFRLQGNEAFKAGDYDEAASHYLKGVATHGPKPVIMSNLAAAYLKIEEYDDVEWAATIALEYDPRNIKARFRRGLARKESFFLAAAATDFETIITHDANCHDAKKELASIREMQNDSDDDGSEFYGDEVYPRFSDEPWPTYSDSDSADCKHTGKEGTIACRFYNHEGCSRNSECKYSHAPDVKSVRDELGRNVCVRFLLGDCKFGAKCVYSHDRTHLPANGWWNYPEQIIAAKTLQGIVEHGSFENLDAILKASPRGRKFAARHKKQHIIRGLADRCNFELGNQQDVNVALPSASERFVLLVSMEDPDIFTSIHEHFLAALRKKASVISADTPQRVAALLQSPGLLGVYATDAAISRPKHHSLLKKLVEYTKNGGVVVAGGLFSNYVRPNQFSAFAKAWDLEWEYGSYHRTTFSTNPANEIVKRNPSLAPSYSMKSLHVAKIRPEHAIYIPTKDSQLQSLVWAPSKITNLSEAPAACAQVGSGLFGFIGDVNGEETSTKTVMAMLGLLDAPHPYRKGTSEPEQAQANMDGSDGPRISVKNGPSPRNGRSLVEEGASSSLDGTPTLQNANTSAAASTKTSPKCIVIVALENNDMFERVYADHLAALAQRAEVKLVRTAAELLVHCGLPNLGGVFVADEGLAKDENTNLLGEIVKYVNEGGIVVFGGLFSTMTAPMEYPVIFNAFGLPWKSGSYERTDAELNKRHATAAKNPGLCEAFSMKAVHVTGFHFEDLLYLPYPSNGERLEAPVLQSRVGNGRLGYIGDVNAEPEVTNIMLAMFDLLTSPKPTIPDSQKFVMIVLRPSTLAVWEECSKEFLVGAKEKAEILVGLSNARVIELLDSADLLGVLVVDAHVCEPENAYLVSKLVQYSKNGGKLIFGGWFSGNVTLTEFRPFFRDNWGLNWDLKGSQYATMTKNNKNPLVKTLDDSKLPRPFYADGISIDGISQSEAVYTAQNMPHWWSPKRKIFQSTVAYAGVEKGHIGYIGFGNQNKETSSIIYAMLGLL